MSANATVVIPCYTEHRWELLCRAIATAQAQRPEPARVIVVVDHNDRLLDRLRREWPDVEVMPNKFERGVSGARNTGAEAATTEFIAWLDDDASARQGWLAGLLEPFDDPRVVGTGGAVVPAWPKGAPDWFPEEFLWAVGAAFTGLPTTRVPVRNVWAASMAARADTFWAVNGFRRGFGKVGTRSCPEDTDLCMRMGAHGLWMYVPDSLIDHPVLLDRSTFRYFLRRCYLEGRGKVEMARLQSRDAGGGTGLGDERGYLTGTVPRGLLRELKGALRGRRGALRRAGAIVSGVAAAGVGAVVELLPRGRSAVLAPVAS